MFSHLIKMSMLWIGMFNEWLRCPTDRVTKCRHDGQPKKCEIPTGLKNRQKNPVMELISDPIHTNTGATWR